MGFSHVDLRYNGQGTGCRWVDISSKCKCLTSVQIVRTRHRIQDDRVLVLNVADPHVFDLRRHHFVAVVKTGQVDQGQIKLAFSVNRQMDRHVNDSGLVLRSKVCRYRPYLIFYGVEILYQLAFFFSLFLGTHGGVILVAVQSRS